MDKLLNFGVANGLLALLPFLRKELVHSDPFLFVKVIKAQSAGEPILIMLVSKDTVATGA